MLLCSLIKRWVGPIKREVLIKVVIKIDNLKIPTACNNFFHDLDLISFGIRHQSGVQCVCENVIL